jgi:hypothetical protein
VTLKPRYETKAYQQAHKRKRDEAPMSKQQASMAAWLKAQAAQAAANGDTGRATRAGMAAAAIASGKLEFVVVR